MEGWFSKQYLADWSVSVVGILVSYILFETEAIVPFDRYLPPDFQEASYPLKPDIVPTWLAFLFVTVIPLLVIFVTYLLHKNKHDVHHAILTLAESILFAYLFTGLGKVLAGRYRPNYYASVENNGGQDFLDGRQSFPSGHSSVSFAGMMFVSLYFAGKVGLFRKNGGQIWKSLVCLLPLIIAFLIAISRTRDYHHNFSDIVAGSFIGVLSAIYAYFLQYPSLLDDHCDIPKFRYEMPIIQ